MEETMNERPKVDGVPVKACPRKGCTETPVLSYSKLIDGYLILCPVHGTRSEYRATPRDAAHSWNDANPPLARDEG